MEIIFLDKSKNSWIETGLLDDKLIKYAEDNFSKLFNIREENYKSKVLMGNKEIDAHRYYKSYLNIPKREDNCKKSYMFYEKSEKLPEEFLPFAEYFPDFNQITINWFSDGKDFIPYHRDWNSENSEILILTLNEGDPRTFYLKALSLTKNSLEKKIGIKTEMGTIIKLCGNTNKKYKHGIQMEPNLNSRRISLSFRKFLKD